MFCSQAWVLFLKRAAFPYSNGYTPSISKRGGMEPEGLPCTSNESNYDMRFCYLHHVNESNFELLTYVSESTKMIIQQ